MNEVGKERIEMEITVGKMGTAENMERRSDIGAAGQQNRVSERMEKQKDWKEQQNTEKQRTSYDAVSMYGDTLSFSKAGKTASSENGSKLVSEDTIDGIVIQKKSGESEHGQESEVSTINLSTYTESELKQMYLDGDITRAEYNEEISSREMRT